MEKGVAAAWAIAFLDMLTTYLNMNLYGTCELERNPVLKAMCEGMGYNAVWVWLPIEVAVIALSYEWLKRLRGVLGVRAPIEDLFLALTAAPIVNNIVMIARALQSTPQPTTCTATCRPL
jgi:hypothetical protein